MAEDDHPAETAAEAHGADRASSGFTVEEMTSEYRALRASMIRLWTSANDGLTTFESGRGTTTRAHRGSLGGQRRLRFAVAIHSPPRQSHGGERRRSDAEQRHTRLLEASEMRYRWRTNELIVSARSSSFVCVIGVSSSRARKAQQAFTSRRSETEASRCCATATTLDAIGVRLMRHRDMLPSLY